MRSEFIRRHGPAEILLGATAAGALLLGIFVYLFDRDWGSALFLSAFATHQPPRLDLFGAAGPLLPSFLHAYVFSALIAAALWPWPRSRTWACFGWFSVAGALELMQMPAAAAASGRAHLDALTAYAVYGQFDIGDLTATACGCLLTYAVTIIMRKAS